jgi:ribosomal protein L11 methyltransferase
MPYLAYHFQVDPPQPGSEILAATIADMGFESFEYNDAGLTAYINRENAGTVNLGDLKFDDFTYSYTIEELPEKNWNEEWEKNFEPVVIDNLLSIRAPFHPANKNVKTELVIMPQMSFGTGHHQTTRLMCRTMCELDLTGTRVLDMGTGTGILAILALKLGARSVVAIDNDEWSVLNAKENCERNGCGSIKVMLGDDSTVKQEEPFDVILANINRNVLMKQMAVYSDKLIEGGNLLMSGFFVTDVEDLAKCAETNSLTMVSRAAEEEWATVICRKVAGKGLT